MATCISDEEERETEAGDEHSFFNHSHRHPPSFHLPTLNGSENGVSAKRK
jgi:hypothetical protein